MDTTTVLAIIDMLETRIDYCEQLDRFDAKWELIEFRDHLQSFIEAQLNAAELQSGE
jgi:hypothetical protein